MNAIEFEPKYTRAICSDIVVVLAPVLNTEKSSQVLDGLSRYNLIDVLRQDRLFSDGGRRIVLIVELRLSADSIY